MSSNSNLYYSFTMLGLDGETLLLKNGLLQMLGSSKPLYFVNTTWGTPIKTRAYRKIIKYKLVLEFLSPINFWFYITLQDHKE